MQLQLPPNRIVTLDSRISGAHTLPYKNISATAPDHIDFVKLHGKMMNDVKSRFSLVL